MFSPTSEFLRHLFCFVRCLFASLGRRRCLGNRGLATMCLMLFGGLVVGPSVAADKYDMKAEASIDDMWRWTKLEALEGLEIDKACEGIDGDVWFSKTTEIIRYDGVELERFPIPENQWVRKIEVSKAGELYLLTNKGFYFFEDGQFSKFSERFDSERSIADFCLSAEGVLWLRTRARIYRVDESGMTSFGTQEFKVSSMVIDRKGMLWISQAGERTTYVYDTLNPVDGRLEVAYRFENELEHNRMNLFVDSKDRVWVLCPDKEGDYYLFENYEKRLAVTGLPLVFNKTFNVDIAELSSGQIWLITARRIAEVSTSDAKLYSIKEFPLPTSRAFVVALANDRLLVGGLESDVYLIDLSSKHGANYSGVNFQCEGLGGAYWFLTHDGRVVSLDEASGSAISYGHADGVIDSPNRVYCSSDGTVWVSGMHEGVAAFCYLFRGGWKRKVFPELGSIFSHLSVVELKDGTIVFGVGNYMGNVPERLGGAVYCRFEEGVVETTSISPPNFPDRPESIVEREGDGLWFGGMSIGRLSVDQELSYNEELGIKSNRWVDHLVLDTNNDVWAGVWGKGIFQYNGVEWRTHSKENGLSSNNVITLLSRKFGTGLWAVMSDGLNRYDGEKWSFWNASFGARFLRESNTLYESSDGSLWINFAYRQWLLEGVRDQKRKDLFRVVRYRGEQVPADTRIVEFKEKLPEGSPVLIRWSGSDSWSVTKKSDLEYSWRLDQGEWSGFSRETNVALYDIKAGTYTFEVRARDFNWNVDSSPAMVTFELVPPVWKRLWFILLMLALVAIIAFLINRLFHARVQSALALEKFKLDFFTNISHELRNPLSVIIGPLESLIRRETAEKAKQSLGVALRNARKMQGLIDQLLQFRKLELGKSQINASVGEVVGFLKEAVASHAPLWEAKGQLVTVHSSPEHFSCGFDAEKLEKILDNLFSNAIKYSGDEAEIRVSIEIVPVNRRHELILMIEDHGSGIPAHEIELVLKPFYRVRSSREGSDSGFGIGLALVGELVGLWGGEIDLKSPLAGGDRGTCATVRLPLFDVEDVRDAVVEPVVDDPKDGSEIGRSTRARILLVEDNEDLRLFMRDELSENYDVFEASNGRLGLAAAIKQDLDLIITDVMMPEMDGFELCRELRGEPSTSHVPIIMLTAKGAEESYVEGIESGADAYFAKPLNMLRLLTQIESLLEMRRTLRLRFSETLLIEPTEVAIVSTDREMLERAMKIVEEHMSDVNFDVDRFAREMGMGRSTLFRKLKGLTGQAPNSFIRSMRLKRAAQLLESGKLSVSETLGYVGIHELSYFSKIFKKQFGVSPSQYSAKHSQADK